MQKETLSIETNYYFPSGKQLGYVCLEDHDTWRAYLRSEEVTLTDVFPSRVAAERWADSCLIAYDYLFQGEKK